MKTGRTICSDCFEKETLIKEFLNLENVHEGIIELLHEYIDKYPDNLDTILKNISALAVRSLNRKEEEINLGLNGIEYLIGHLYNSIRNKATNPKHVIEFIVPMMAYFSKGKSDGASKAGKGFYDFFVDCLRDDTKIINSDWAKNMNNGSYNSDWAKNMNNGSYNDYLLLIAKENKIKVPKSKKLKI